MNSFTRLMHLDSRSQNVLATQSVSKVAFFEAAAASTLAFSVDIASHSANFSSSKPVPDTLRDKLTGMAYALNEFVTIDIEKTVALAAKQVEWRMRVAFEPSGMLTCSPEMFAASLTRFNRCNVMSEYTTGVATQADVDLFIDICNAVALLLDVKG